MSHATARQPGRLAFVDLETTGLLPEQHEIIGAGVVVVSLPAWEVVSELEIHVHPRRPAEASPEALRVNGYTWMDWKRRGASDDAEGGERLMFQHLDRALRDAALCGHHVAFEEGFLRRHWPAWRRPWRPGLCSMQLARGLRVGGAISSARLEDACNELGLQPPSPPHRPLEDARASMRLTRRILDLMTSAFASAVTGGGLP